MKREYLKELGLAEDVIDKVMAENGKDINELKTAGTTAQTTIADLQKQICDRDKQLDTLKKSSGDNEALQQQITDLQAANETAQTEYEEKLEALKLESEIGEVLAAKAFVNDFTKDSIRAKMLETVKSSDSKGKSYADILAALTQGEDGKPLPNIFTDAKPGNPPPPVNGTPPAPDEKDEMTKWLAEAGIPPQATHKE